ncbi:MFS transporter [Candidatus Bathyarchaeota archaeon]|nr:MAG: MFS transporter [Candidatus Bathyarchaeota archaeon]
MNRKAEQTLVKGLGINIILLGIVSFINDASSDMIWPILPMFIKSIGGTGVAVGLIGGLGESVSSILKVFSGYWSDRFGRRKPLVASGYLLSSVSKLFFPFINSWIHLLILRPIERVGKGIRTAPRDAIIAGSVSEDVRGKGFGIHRALDTSGAILGSILAFIFIWFFNLDLRAILLIAAVLGFVALTPLIFVRDVTVVERRVSLKMGLGRLGRRFQLVMLVLTIFALGNFTYMFFVLRAQEVFQGFLPKRMAEAIPILLYVLFNISYALLSIPIGMLSDKVGRGRILSVGYVLFGVVCLGFIISNSVYSFILLFIMYGLFKASVDAVQRAYISDLAPEGLRGTALGTFHASIGLATLPASAIAGMLWDKVSPEATFLYGAALGLLASLSLIILMAKFRD